MALVVKSGEGWVGFGKTYQNTAKHGKLWQNLAYYATRLRLLFAFF